MNFVIMYVGDLMNGRKWKKVVIINRLKYQIIFVSIKSLFSLSLYKNFEVKE